jgi:hypothetical protein
MTRLQYSYMSLSGVAPKTFGPGGFLVNSPPGSLSGRPERRAKVDLKELT